MYPMTESSQTASFNDRSDKTVGDRLETGSASSAPEKGAGSAGSATAPTRAAPRSRRHSGAVLARQADELMSSPAITTQTTEPVFSVARLMLDSGIDGVPVLDPAGRPVGMVSDGDLLGRRGEGRPSPWLDMLAKQSPPPRSALERPVGEVMSAPLISISRKASVRDIAETFRAHGIKRLPVLDGGSMVGVVTRADLLPLVDELPAAPSAGGDKGGGGLLEFLESMIGGASLRGGLERAPAPASAPRGEKAVAIDALSAKAFRDAVRARKLESLDQKQTTRREAQLERERQVHAFLDQHVTDASWSEMLEKAKFAALNGEQEYMLLRFPSDLCSDGGRKIDVAEEGWEGTLRGAAAELYGRWRTDLKPQGFSLSARIVSYDDGIVGDLGLYLTWRGD
jgi:CBS domain-containing protein